MRRRAALCAAALLLCWPAQISSGGDAGDPAAPALGDGTERTASPPPGAAAEPALPSLDAAAEPAAPPSPGVRAEPAADTAAVSPAEALGCADRVAKRVQAHYDEVRDLAARFEQHTASVAFGPGAGVQTSAGEVEFAKPGRMRWAYESPEPSLVVSDGGTLWIFDPVAREAQKLAVGRAFLSAAAIQFLLGDGRIADAFQVSAEACDPAAERVTLRLLPREEATYEFLELVAEPASGTIRETAVVDLFGNRTVVVFRDVRTNQGLEASRFRFEPPPDVRVLSLPEAP